MNFFLSYRTVNPNRSPALDSVSCLATNTDCVTGHGFDLNEAGENRREIFMNTFFKYFKLASHCARGSIRIDIESILSSLSIDSSHGLDLVPVSDSSSGSAYDFDSDLDLDSSSVQNTNNVAAKTREMG
ncbi:hypothetical protein EVAR_36279_1 [Eumeta japonica]|uniref:Uncharacterized protein n=1 Tax=Eumeta variegata TaxID=151549 RepID=A0A4C1VJ57_EUMVA|nr:hypothetical protein EVAR_36279_1 [Eumeta japonica]